MSDVVIVSVGAPLLVLGVCTVTILCCIPLAIRWYRPGGEQNSEEQVEERHGA